MQKKVIKRNIIKCKKCGTTIESKYRHDFKWCKCKSVAVDGGKDYLRRLGSPEDYDDLSILINSEKSK
jgi:tRNA(Ile2) C34 agmatinyltransferase TiaS